jgi:threonine dehydrogenase-like Zn-dependent dehydrogenase
MSCNFRNYVEIDYKIPEKTTAWNMYAAGTENIGRNGMPELEDVPEPDNDQLLVRVDAVGLCFSDVKLIKLGKDHPKLYGRDLSTNPTRLGHEAAFTVIKVGKNLIKKYHAGQRLAVQPDIYQNQISTAYGYTIPGGLTQYHLLGPEVLDADDGSYVLPIEGDVGYAEAALTEPWACVDAAYTQRRRLSPKAGGSMWIVGQPGDDTEYSFSSGPGKPKLIYMTNVPDNLKSLIQEKKTGGAKVIVTENIRVEDYPVFSKHAAGGDGFDDIILLAPTSAKMVEEAAKLIAFRGTFNIVGREPLDGNPLIDAGRIHYHYTAYVGTMSADIAAAYGVKRNRCELKTGGVAVFIGAGGPMGQMHVQRAVGKKNGPAIVIATEINQKRAAVLSEIISPLAAANDKQFWVFNPDTSEISLADFIKEKTGEASVDDAVVCVPVASLMEEGAKLLNVNGMLVLFAGVPIGTYAEMNVDAVYLHNKQLTGTSGSKLEDQEVILKKTLERELNTNRSVAAIGGIEVAKEGLEAMMSGKFAGKIIIFPQVSGMPLIGLEELKDTFPEIGKKLGENNLWTIEAEKALIENFWYGENK